MNWTFGAITQGMTVTVFYQNGPGMINLGTLDFSFLEGDRPDIMGEFLKLLPGTIGNQI